MTDRVYDRVPLSIEVEYRTAGAFLVAYTIFTAYVLIAALVTNVAVILTLAALLAVFLLLDFGLAGNPSLIPWAGYVGMIDALMALYISAAGLLATLWGHPVLPVGAIQRAAPKQQLQKAAA